jgi:hypothetical protein
MTTSLVDERFRREAERYALRFGCESCVHFSPDAGACGNGYPTHPHLSIQLSRVNTLEFCKDFELA